MKHFLLIPTLLLYGCSISIKDIPTQPQKPASPTFNKGDVVLHKLGKTKVIICRKTLINMENGYTVKFIDKNGKYETMDCYEEELEPLVEEKSLEKN